MNYLWKRRKVAIVHYSSVVLTEEILFRLAKENLEAIFYEPFIHEIEGFNVVEAF